MTIAFTVCSNNFLAQAKAMLDSLHVHHPDVTSLLFLVDEKEGSIDYQSYEPSELIFVNESVVPGFTSMLDRYTVIELNTAVRPFLFQYITDRFNSPSRVYYLDPDMYIYNKMEATDKLLDDHFIILTPHFTEPIPLDGAKPFEDLALIYGVYNAGFLAMNLSHRQSDNFLQWWGERTIQFAYTDTSRGLFTDQIWFNLVPVFFDNVHILKHKGYNMAIWNLHERKIREYEQAGKVSLENDEMLVIYHFSNWNYFEPEILSKGLDRFDFKNRPDLVKLYKDYRDRLRSNDHDRIRKLPCRLPVQQPKQRSIVKKALTPGLKILKGMWQKI